MHQSPSTAPAAVTGEAAAAASETKVLDFAARLDARLDDLDPAEGETFLSNLLLWWVARYERFVAESADDSLPDGEMTAFDYVACISEINVRQGRLRSAVPA